MSDIGSFGYGQQRPQDHADWSNTIDFIVRQRIAQINTIKVVKVMAFHPGAAASSDLSVPPTAPGTVDVLPLVNQIDGNGYAVQHQTIFGIPIWRLTGGAWQIICEPLVGEVGLLLCCDRDSSSVVRNADGNQATPGSRRKYSLSDGIYLGGILNPVPKAVMILTPGGHLEIKDADGNEMTSFSGSWLFKDTFGNQLTGNAQGWQITGNLTVTGNLAVDGTVGSGSGGGDSVGLQTHTHSGVTTGAGVSGPPTPGT